MQPTTQDIKNELTGDPKARGYASKITAGELGNVTALLNGTYAGVGVVYRTDITGAQILGALVWSEIATLVTNSWLALQTLLIPNTPIDASNQLIRDLFGGIFAGKTVTLANLTTLAQKAAPSRAEELWGYGTVITLEQVVAAVRS